MPQPIQSIMGGEIWLEDLLGNFIWNVVLIWAVILSMACLYESAHLPEAERLGMLRSLFLLLALLGYIFLLDWLVLGIMVLYFGAGVAGGWVREALVHV